jgi:hypothetical protein
MREITRLERFTIGGPGATLQVPLDPCPGQGSIETLP